MGTPRLLARRPAELLVARPQEETTIEIFSWDRQKRSTERATTTEIEVTSDVTETMKDSDEVLKEVTRDSSFQAQAKGELSISAIGLTIGGGIDSKSAVRDVAKATHNHIEETVGKTSAKVKANRQTKIAVTSEFGREERITRKVRNPNMCHALSLDYFEILANYAVRTEFDAVGARLCVLLENPVDFRVDRTLLRVHEDTLRPALLAPSHRGGFDAARLLAARERACAAACHQCDCTPSTPSVDQNAEITAAWQAVREALLQFTGPPVNLLVHAQPTAFYMAVKSDDLKSPTFHNAREQFYQWLYLTALVEAGAGGFVRRFRQLVGDVALADKKQFAEDFWWYIQSLSDRVLNTPELHADEKDSLWKFHVKPSLESSVDFLANPVPGKVSLHADVIKWHLGERLEDAGLPSVIERFKAAYKAHVATLAAAGKSREQLAAASLAREKEATSTINDAYPLDAVTEAEEREEALIRHIEANKPYYRFAMWRSLDAATQRTRLSPGGGVIGRLIAPEAVGYYGDRLAFPVAPRAHEQLKKWFTDNLTTNTDVTGLAGERTVTLPTPGIAVETRLSQCDACEDYIREQRRIDLRTRAARASKDEQEAERYQQRLKQQPPLLDDPDRPEGPLRIELEQRPRQP